jgi:8-oxo-dGTP diphosphatase
MINYVLGFLFNNTMDRVVLINKQKPDWQKDHLNGIGGKIEDDESTIDAMTREFNEETGLCIDEWELFAFMEGKEWRVDCFYHRLPDNFEPVVKRLTDEVPLWLDVLEIEDYRHISNIPWLVRVCVDKSRNNSTPYGVTLLL